MSDVAVASIISTVLATAATLITAWLRSRGHPTRYIVNAEKLVDTQGKVLLNLNEEIDKYREEIEQLETDVEAARVQARDAQRQAENCALEVRRLHAFLRSNGFDPEALP